MGSWKRLLHPRFPRGFCINRDEGLGNSLPNFRIGVYQCVNQGWHRFLRIRLHELQGDSSVSTDPRVRVLEVFKQNGHGRGTNAREPCRCIA